MRQPAVLFNLVLFGFIVTFGQPLRAQSDEIDRLTEIALKAASQAEETPKLDLLEPEAKSLRSKSSKEKESNKSEVASFYSGEGKSDLSPYSPRLETTESPEVGYFPDKTKDEESGEAEPGSEDESLTSLLKQLIAKLNKDQGSQNSRVREAPAEREAIVEKFGNPDERVPVLGIKDAPLPFQAMQAAAQAGDTELLRAYTKQYVLYLKDVQDRTKMVTDAINEAMKEEQMLPGQKPGTTQAGIVQEEQIDEAKIRKELRSAIAAKDFPVDPYGEVDVYAFIKIDSENSIQMLPEIDVFERTVKADRKIKFAVYLAGEASAEELAQFKKKHNLKFDILPGAEMAKKLGVRGVPTTVFATHNTKKLMVEEGYRRYFFLDEVVRYMQGKPVGTAKAKANVAKK